MLEIRAALRPDVSAIQAIYAHHVLNGTSTFDTDPPDVRFWEQKLATLAARGWPFLVAEQGGEPVGYCYATQIRERPAYAPCCEDSIYVRADRTGRGIGTALLHALIGAARDAGFEQMIAVVGGGEPASVTLHARCGFTEVGRLRNVGFKFGRYLDSVYMQRDLRG
ncbi:MAG: GCN5 family acetyltransferase [Sphingomonadales bacterium BRH_c42]|nr:MAG: GCN5 family acetyltransferase [Sphingomonadales bacterium BRH_c42]